MLDAFAGVGGNAIQFAREGLEVVAVEIDSFRMKCMKKNAEVFE